MWSKWLSALAKVAMALGQVTLVAYVTAATAAEEAVKRDPGAASRWLILTYCLVALWAVLGAASEIMQRKEIKKETAGVVSASLDREKRERLESDRLAITATMALVHDKSEAGISLLSVRPQHGPATLRYDQDAVADWKTKVEAWSKSVADALRKNPLVMAYIVEYQSFPKEPDGEVGLFATLHLERRLESLKNAWNHLDNELTKIGLRE